MFHSKVSLLAFLLLATEVLTARIVYSAKYKGKDRTQHTSKNANVPDDKKQLIIDNMRTWSDNKYSAGLSRHVDILVTNAEPAASIGKAGEEIQEMQSIVNRNIRDGQVEGLTVLSTTNQTSFGRLEKRLEDPQS